MLTRFKKFKPNLIQNLRRFAAIPPAPDGEDRNDYEHPSFKSFNYNRHGRDWGKGWPLADLGVEQSPIALYR